MNLDKQVGAQIRKFRLEKGLSQEELGFRSNMTQAQINKLETGKQRFNSDQIESVCESLNIPIIYLFLDDTEISLYSIITQMPEYKKQELAKVLINLEDFDFGNINKAVELINGLKKELDA